MTKKRDEVLFSETGPTRGSGHTSAAEHLSSVADGDSLDWKEIPAEEITQRVLTQVKGGSIILFHNAAPHTPEALPGIIEALQRDGYTLCTVSDLLVEGPYTIDSAGVQHPASESS